MYDYQKTVILSKVRYWIYLRLQDFKSVSEKITDNLENHGST